MKKRAYYTACLRQPVEWLRLNLTNPSPYQTPMALALIRLAIRNMERHK
jgi:hypothetical protein